MKFDWKYYLITTLLLVTGILAILSLFAFAEKTNTMFGKPVYYDNNLPVTKLEYSRTGVTFYENEDKYIVELELSVFDNFDGNYNKYSIKLNDFAFFANVHDGLVVFDICNNFKNADGSLIVKDTLSVRIEFLNTCTKFVMTTTSADGVNCWQSLFNTEGFNLVIEQVN